MAEEKKDTWLNYLALTTVIFAVCATLSTFKGGGYSTRAVMSQTQAANQWAYFQSKSIKSYIYEVQKDGMELSLKNGLSQFGAYEYTKKIDQYSQKIKKYEEEKTAIEKDARALEKRKEDAQRHSEIFGMAVIFLQIAILLSSIAALLKKRPIWYIGVGTGALGLVYFVNGFFLFF